MRLTRTFLWLCLAILSGLAGYFIPAYFRAVDPLVLEIAAEESADRQAIAESFIVGGYPGAARYLLDQWPSEAAPATGGELPATGLLLSSSQRSQAVSELRDSSLEGVRRLLPQIPVEPDPETPPEARLTLLPIRIGGILTTILAEERQLQPALLGKLVTWATSSDPSSTERWDTFAQQVAVWGSVAPLDAIGQALARIDDPADFLQLAALANPPAGVSRNFLIQLVLGGAEAPLIVEYLDAFPSSGKEDLPAAMTVGPGAVHYLLQANLPIHEDSLIPAPRQIPNVPELAHFAYAFPVLAVWIRTVLFLATFVCLFSALALWLPNPGDRFLDKPGPFQTFARRVILASISTAGLLFTFEPSLFQQPDTAATPATTASLSFSSLSNPPIEPTMMNSITIDSVTLLILSIFLVLQLGLYVFCLVKLSEIRQQQIADNTKIQLLENEENLFDSGLYLGLGGTVASLILLAVGVVEASLMAAYASTLFGILFVSFFKIFHLRPLKRRLILSANRAG